jgi:PBP1b-binding outer membrane lipoprotein LpoB
MKKLVLVLIAAVLVAGCTGQPPSPNQGGGTNVEAADVMVAPFNNLEAVNRKLAEERKITEALVILVKRHC